MTVRDPEATREGLLAAGFEEIYGNGYQGARVDRILERTGVTKGAFYHHFPTKRALCEAVLDEVIGTRVAEMWVEPLRETKDPLTTIRATFESCAVELSSGAMLACGCPLNKLAEEMAPLDEGLRERIHRHFEIWRNGIELALDRGRQAGSVAPDTDPREASFFILASIEGAMSLMKSAQDPRILEGCARGLGRYLESLRP